MIDANAYAQSAESVRTRRVVTELALAQRFATDIAAAALERYGSGAFDVIDLPTIMGPSGELSPAQLRAVGVLLWAREVEQAGLPGFVDALADGIATGKVLLSASPAAMDRLIAYWQTRHERFSPEERDAIYRRLFGGAGQTEHPFGGLFEQLLRALDELAHAGRGMNVLGMQVRINTAARDIAAWLSQHSGGIVAFAARDIVEQIKSAMSILRSSELGHALGGGSIWQIMRLHAQEILGRSLEPESHLQRASAALDIVRWLADAAAAIDSGSAALPPASVLQAAEVWLSAGAGA